MSNGVKVSRAGKSPATSSTNLSEDPYSLSVVSPSLKTNQTVPSLVRSSIASDSILDTKTVPPISSEGNAVVRTNAVPSSPQRFSMLRACKGLRELWGSNFNSILDEHERINDEVDALQKRMGVS